MRLDRVLPPLFGFPLGLVGLFVGLYGPAFLSTEYPQIPIGIFCCPAGFGFGWLFGQRLARNNSRVLVVWAAFLGMFVLIALSALVLSIPGSRVDGFLLNGEVLSCQPQTSSGKQGVMLRVRVLSRKVIYSSRARWSAGKLSAHSETPISTEQRYFVPGDSCANYTVGSHISFAWEDSIQVPPERPGDILFVPILEPIPQKYRQFELAKK